MDVPALGRFPGIPAADLTEEQRDCLDRLVGKRGFVPAPYRAWITVPYLVSAFTEHGSNMRKKGTLTDRELEIAVLTAARHFGADYVVGSHRRLGAKAGLEPPVLDALSEGREPKLDDPKERMVYELVRTLLREPKISADFAAKAEKELGLYKVVELFGLIGSYAATSMTMKFFDVPAA